MCLDVYKLVIPSMDVHYTAFYACILTKSIHKFVFPGVEIPYTVFFGSSGPWKCINWSFLAWTIKQFIVHKTVL